MQGCQGLHFNRHRHPLPQHIKSLKLHLVRGVAVLCFTLVLLCREPLHYAARIHKRCRHL